MTAGSRSTARSALFPPGVRTMMAGFETTHLPVHDVDVAELTDHTGRWQEDLDRALAAGVRHFRTSLRWPRIEPEPGRFDWSEPDRVLGHLRERGAAVVVDLVHHTSHPNWLTGGFADPAFGDSFLRFGRAVIDRYSWLPAYTIFNEPFATLFLAGHEALWPPYHRGMRGFVGLLRNVLPAIVELSHWYRSAVPEAAHVWIDTAEHHQGVGPGADHAAMANDRRHLVLDLFLGRHLERDRPIVRALVEAGGESLLHLESASIDLLGLDYYSHSEWFYDDLGGHAPSPQPIGFAAVAEHYAQRYGVPVLLTETNLRGFPTDRASWLRYMVQECESAQRSGVDLRGFCWFPLVDSCDWDSLLARPARRTDPVGVWSLTPENGRSATPFTRAWQMAASGRPAADLPGYRLQAPCAEQLVGYRPAMSHWDFRSTPPEFVHPPVLLTDRIPMAHS